MLLLLFGTRLGRSLMLAAVVALAVAICVLPLRGLEGGAPPSIKQRASTLFDCPGPARSLQAVAQHGRETVWQVRCWSGKSYELRARADGGRVRWD